MEEKRKKNTLRHIITKLFKTSAKEKNLKRNLSTQTIYKHKDTSDRFLAENNASQKISATTSSKRKA